MSNIKITFSGQFDVVDALVFELASQDVVPTVNSAIVQMSQFNLGEGIMRYEFIYTTPDAKAFSLAISEFIKKNYLSISLDDVSEVESPAMPASALSPKITEVPGSQAVVE
jgi:hypothetical protein